MGNCLRSDKILAGKEKIDDLKPQPLHTSSKEEEESERESTMIKVVVSKQELRQILDHGGGINSVEHLVHVLKLKGKNISKVHVQEEDDKRGGCDDGKWRPKLESIPENYY
ncbi:hypothetical protein EUTSA_v10026860mg [Eutrema salsugineum]|uniref:Uncharacterized protein n=1 Tax=Eutrema salsugineum TaxID=72664 RepID=V4P8L3_EUTSA|nr:uncharacterized protein LOC18028815 [Eutrema salsugineum]ESQ55971.1 hypothetical protein EUTSA_v10026860mg [Eutrema salsugineum]